MLMTILRSLINPSRRIAVPAVASIMITFCAVGGAAADRPDSFGQDADFFAFYRSMEAYRKSMNNNDTSLVLSPDSSFFRFFKDKNGDE